MAAVCETRQLKGGGWRGELPCAKPKPALTLIPRSINTPCVMQISRTVAIFFLFHITCRTKEDGLQYYNTACSRVVLNVALSLREGEERQWICSSALQMSLFLKQLTNSGFNLLVGSLFFVLPNWALPKREDVY